MALSDISWVITGAKHFGCGSSSWQIELALRQVAQTRTEIEAKQFRYCHPQFRVPVRVNGKFDQSSVVAGVVVTDNAFNRHAGLALVQHDRMVIDDAVLLQHVRVDTHGLGATSR